VTEPKPPNEAGDIVETAPQPADVGQAPAVAAQAPPVAGQVPPAAPASPAPPEPKTPEPVPGDRMPPPLGATRVIADYGRPHPSYVFLALVSILTLAADVASKAWAEHHLEGYPGTLEIWKNHLTLVLARNRGGAWGLLQTTSENVRRPFFLLVSVAAIVFIMTLYRRLQWRQVALKWGLPLVLGGALGNVLDRIRYGHVIDFIDAHVVVKGIEHHWPTFNIADIAICVGVGLMAIDMFTSKRGRGAMLRDWRVPPAQSGERVPDWHDPAAPPASEGEPKAGELPPVDVAPPASPPAGESATIEGPQASEANR
jgi:lipoprotein signal peptidase